MQHFRAEFWFDEGAAERTFWGLKMMLARATDQICGNERACPTYTHSELSIALFFEVIPPVGDV